MQGLYYVESCFLSSVRLKADRFAKYVVSVAAVFLGGGCHAALPPKREHCVTSQKTAAEETTKYAVSFHFNSSVKTERNDHDELIKILSSPETSLEKKR